MVREELKVTKKGWYLVRGMRGLMRKALGVSENRACGLFSAGSRAGDPSYQLLPPVACVSVSV